MLLEFNASRDREENLKKIGWKEMFMNVLDKLRIIQILQRDIR